MAHPLEVLMTLGEDALSNHYQLVIPALPNGIGISALTSLNMRVLSVEIPDQAVSTYEITKRGRKASRPGGVSEQNLAFSITYRVDKYYQCYVAISQWLAYIQNPLTMGMASDSGPAGVGGPSTFRSDVSVIGLDTNNVVTTTGWVFQGAFPKSQSSISFEEGGGEPITCTVEFACTGILYPGQ